jgi:hypothetical protein
MPSFIEGISYKKRHSRARGNIYVLLLTAGVYLYTNVGLKTANKGK